MAGDHIVRVIGRRISAERLPEKKAAEVKNNNGRISAGSLAPYREGNKKRTWATPASANPVRTYTIHFRLGRFCEFSFGAVRDGASIRTMAAIRTSPIYWNPLADSFHTITA